MSNIIIKTPNGAQLNWDSATGPLSMSESGATPIPPDPPGGGNTLPTPGPGEIVLPNQPGVSNGVITYPSTNQQYKSSGLSGNKVLLAPWKMPADVPTNRPNNIGSIVTAEVPGQTRVARALEASVNNVVKVPFPTGNFDTGPSLYFTVGNPNGYQNAGASFNIQPGDAVAIRLKNPNGEASNVIIALTPPPNY